MSNNAADKPDILILSSSENYKYAEGIRSNLSRDYETTLWREGFFDQTNLSPLDTFLKKLLYFDAAIIVLGNDDVRLSSPESDERINIPRDNVIFELGATMARYGLSKTFMLVPQSIEVQLPSYFTGINPLTYEQRRDNNYTAATGEACSRIKHDLKKLGNLIFHSDLPGSGLANGYYSNFIQPAIISQDQNQAIDLHDGFPEWVLDDDFSLTILIPSKFMSRSEANEYCEAKLKAKNISMRLRNGRDISVYALPRKSAKQQLKAIDIPTTFLTSRKVIKQVDEYWGRGEDREFRERLEVRESINFARQLKRLIQDDDLVNESKVLIKTID